jgi:predicted MFS family arabinose efflux permease
LKPSRGLILLLAVTSGASVANLYYAQPLLHEIGGDLGVSAGTAALLVTASQVGYAAGLLFLLPLGDLVDRRRLVTRMLLVAAAALVGAAVAPSLAVLALMLAAAGVVSVVAQVVVPLASTLVSPAERGRVVGTVMSGLLIGILAARTVSGLVAELAGWRGVLWLAAAGMLLLAAALHRMLPGGSATTGLSYGRLLASVGTLVRDEPQLRRRMVYGACGMAGFTVLWTSLALLLSEPPFEYSEAIIGLFGLAGLAGAGAAQVAGRLFDAGRTHGSTGGFLVAVAVGWGALALGERHAWLIVVGIVVLDLGVQGQHILNQSTIFGIDEETRSRLNTAYMTSNFVWGALASAAAAWAWTNHGWGGVCVLGGGISAVALAAWAQEQLTRSSGRSCRGS